jgi:hypothetical protein
MSHAGDIIEDLRLLEPANPWLYAGIAAGAAVLVFAIFLLRRRSGKMAILAPAADVFSEDAMAELEKIRSLIQPGNSLAYGRAVSGVVRRYIEGRFGLVAPRRSTEEFLTEAAVSDHLDAVHQSLLAGFLSCCDFMKFGRGQAEVAELEAIHESAVRFVGDTTLEPVQKGGES